MVKLLKQLLVSIRVHVCRGFWFRLWQRCITELFTFASVTSDLCNIVIRTCFAACTNAFQSILLRKPCKNSGWNSASMISIRVQSLKFRGKFVGALHVRA